MKKLFLLLINILAFYFCANAAYLTDIPRQVVQPNGDTLDCYISGDEFHHWLHDKNGYTIVQDANTGYYVYAICENDELIPTKYVAGKVNPASVGLKPHQNISAAKWSEKRAWMEAISAKAGNETKGENANIGNYNNLIIFINFADDEGFTQTAEEIDLMFNDSTPGAVSMYNYFKQTSFGQLDLRSYLFPTPKDNKILSYTDSHPRSYFLAYSYNNLSGYANEEDRKVREHALIQAAVAYVEKMIPTDLDIDHDSNGVVDNVCFIVKGEVSDWSSLLWPHKWNIYSNDCTIHGKRVSSYNFQLDGTAAYFNTSVFCHEMFHSLGAPDLYHYNEGYNTLTPVGRWDLMASNTNPPQQMATWLKYKYGKWIDDVTTITSNGRYVLYPGNDTSGKHRDKMCYIKRIDNTDEYFMFEYRRQSLPNDNTLYGSGLLIYRLNRNFTGNSNYNGQYSFDELYILRPNGDKDYNGDITHAHFDAREGRNVFNRYTNPAPTSTKGILDTTLNITYISEPGDSLVFSIGDFYAHCTPDKIQFDNQIDTVYLTLESNTAWKIIDEKESDSWLGYSPTEGYGDTIITIFTKNSNPSTANRYSKLLVTGDNINFAQEIDIMQNGVPAYFEVSHDSLIFDKEHLSQEIYIKSNVNWSISPEIKDPWFNFSKESGYGDDTITVYIKDTVKFTRQGYCHIKNEYEGHSIFIKQIATDPIFYLENMEDGEGLHIENKAQDITLQLHANMKWFIKTEDTAWVKISKMSGEGDQEIIVSILDSTTEIGSRKGIFYIYGEEDNIIKVPLYQKGVPFSFTATPQIVELGNVSGSKFTVDIKANSSWSTSKTQSWYKISPTFAKGDTTMVISMSTINGLKEKRIDTISIINYLSGNLKQKNFIVITQDTCFIKLSQDTIYLENQVGSTAKFQLSSNSRWYFSGMCGWLSANLTYGSRNSEITITAKEKTSEERYCDITITDRKQFSTHLVVKQLTSVGIDNFSEENIQVYPNPAHEILNIYNNSIRLNHVTIFDMQGRAVLHIDNINDYYTDVNTSALSKGVYNLQIVGDGHVVNKKVIIQ